MARAAGPRRVAEDQLSLFEHVPRLRESRRQRELRELAEREREEIERQRAREAAAARHIRACIAVHGSFFPSDEIGMPRRGVETDRFEIATSEERYNASRRLGGE